MNLQVEKKLIRKGYRKIVGIDEAGRGPLAGPVVAGAVIIKVKNKKSKIKILNQNFKLLKEVKDPKKLTAKKREELYKILTKNPQIEWGIGRVSEKVIDKINILEATKLAMKRAVKNLEKKHSRRRACVSKRQGQSKHYSYVDFLILDGRIKLNVDIVQESIIKADEKIFSCAAASIIAKVRRDAIMKKKDKEYPQYGFARHKGYGTKLHKKMLKKYGPCVIHRKTFKPVREALR